MLEPRATHASKTCMLPAVMLGAVWVPEAAVWVHNSEHTFPVGNDLVRSGSTTDRVQSVPGRLHCLQLRLHSLHQNADRQVSVNI